MSLASQISALATSIGAAVKTLTSRTTAIELAPLPTWNAGTTYRRYQQVVTLGKAWMLVDIEGQTDTAPPGPYLPNLWGGFYVGNPKLPASTYDADGIHGAGFVFPTGQTLYRVLNMLHTPATVAETLKLWILPLSSPAPLDTDTPTATGNVWPGDTYIQFPLTATPFVCAAGVEYAAWVGPTGASAVNKIRTSVAFSFIDSANGGDGSDLAFPVAGEYVTRTRGGSKVFQAAYIAISFFTAPLGTGTKAWQTLITPVATEIKQITLDGTAITMVPSDFRRVDFTNGVVPTTINLIAPASATADVGVQPTAIRIVTPPGVTPAPITWTSLVGFSAIQIPTANNSTVFYVEYLFGVGWFVVGSDSNIVGISAALWTETLSATAVMRDPSLYRRMDFTTSASPVQITLQNPATYPTAGTVLTTRSILLKTPAATTPGAITWINLTGGSSIPMPAASQIVVANIEWVDEVVGWLVVGVRA